jgi:tetrahydromethanopterin S-methyltransferase subunit A
MIYQSNGSYLYYKDDYGIVDSYCQYMVELLKKMINDNNINAHIYFCCEKDDIIARNNNIVINVNFEHTLVKPGGRSTSPLCLMGKVMINNQQNYLVRIDEYDKLMNSDIIIDYSNTNIYNVKTCEFFHEFSKKHIYIAPLVFTSFYDNIYNRDISLLTTFINTNEPRRRLLIDKIKDYDISNVHKNINDCFKKDQLYELYKRTKILINIHQTDHHDTLEEVRILPALQCGVIVISEKSPLTHLVPYSEYILWEEYDNIIVTAINVMNNYEFYYDLIFNQHSACLAKPDMDVLECLHNKNYDTLYNKIKQNII